MVKHLIIKIVEKRVKRKVKKIKEIKSWFSRKNLFSTLLGFLAFFNIIIAWGIIKSIQRLQICFFKTQGVIFFRGTYIGIIAIICFWIFLLLFESNIGSLIFKKVPPKEYLRTILFSFLFLSLLLFFSFHLFYSNWVAITESEIKTGPSFLGLSPSVYKWNNVKFIALDNHHITGNPTILELLYIHPWFSPHITIKLKDETVVDIFSDPHPIYFFTIFPKAEEIKKVLRLAHQKHIPIYIKEDDYQFLINEIVPELPYKYQKWTKEIFNFAHQLQTEEIKDTSKEFPNVQAKISIKYLLLFVSMGLFFVLSFVFIFFDSLSRKKKAEIKFFKIKKKNLKLLAVITFRGVLIFMLLFLFLLFFVICSE